MAVTGSQINYKTTISSGFAISISPGTTPTLSFFNYTGDIEIYNIRLVNKTLTSTPDGAFGSIQFVTTDSGGTADNKPIAGILTSAAVQSAKVGHIIALGSAIPFFATPTADGTVVSSLLTSLARFFAFKAATGTSIIGMSIGSNNSSINLTGTYDIYIDWNPVTPGATVAAI